MIQFFFLIIFSAWAREPISGSRFQHLTGMKIGQDSKTQWDQRYSRSTFVFGKSPAEFLAQNYEYLPFEGKVLDMGMGEGRNAVFLAQKGFKVTGIDISSVAVKKAYLLAQEFGVSIKGVVASLKDYKIQPKSYDAIICFYYVDRSMIEKMKTWLKPGGVIIFEAYTENQMKRAGKNSDLPEFYLKNQELIKLFDGYQILKFEEPLHTKQFQSSIIVKKPL